MEFRSSGVQTIPLDVIAYLKTLQPYNLIKKKSKTYKLKNSNNKRSPLPKRERTPI